MLFTSILLATAASLAAAQSTNTTVSTTSTSSAVTGGYTCAAQAVLDACIGTEQAQVNSCQPLDYSCLCNAYTDLLTCYNNCPGDATVSTVQAERDTYCNDASVYGSTTIMVAPSSTVSALTTATASTASTTGATFGAAGTSAAASASATNSNAAVIVTADLAGGLLGFVAAGMALIL